MKPKFRAWEEKSKTMLDWNCLNQTVFNSINILYAYNQYLNNGKEDLFYTSWLYKIFHNPEIIIEQYTNVFDKNDNEYCVGDIYQPCTMNDGNIDHWVMIDGNAKPKKSIVKWDENYPTIIVPIPPRDFVIIGNIHENSDLLDYIKWN